jgi:hypothetical protein
MDLASWWQRAMSLQAQLIASMLLVSLVLLRFLKRVELRQRSIYNTIGTERNSKCVPG